MPDVSEVVVTRPVVAADLPAVSALSALVFGPGRFVRTAYRIREGTPEVSPFCRVALLGTEIVAAIRMTDIAIGGKPGALLLGPLAVHPAHANMGHGRRLIAESSAAAAQAQRELILLVGDRPYYGRLGFIPVALGQISLPGPVDRTRLLVLELVAGALPRFAGSVSGLVEGSLATPNPSVAMIAAEGLVA